MTRPYTTHPPSPLFTHTRTVSAFSATALVPPPSLQGTIGRKKMVQPPTPIWKIKGDRAHPMPTQAPPGSDKHHAKGKHVKGEQPGTATGELPGGGRSMYETDMHHHLRRVASARSTSSTTINIIIPPKKNEKKEPFCLDMLASLVPSWPRPRRKPWRIQSRPSSLRSHHRMLSPMPVPSNPSCAC